MALTTGTAGDMSLCVEATVGYFGYHRFESGKIGLTWDFTGGTDELLIGKDPDIVAGDVTVFNNALYLDMIQLAGCASGGNVALYDGSAGDEPVMTLAIGDTTDYEGHQSQLWDFRGDALVCLTAESTESLCISSTINGHISGFLKFAWGPAPI